MIHWGLLLVAVVGEVAATLALRGSGGLTRPLPVLVVVVGYGVAFVLLARVIAELGVGPVYAAWSGLGLVGAAVGGWLLFGERLTVAGVVGMILVLAGVVVLATSGAVAHG